MSGYLSYSQMSLLLGCPEQYRYKYVLNQRAATEPVHFALGSAVTWACEQNLRQKMVTGSDVSPSQMVTWFDRAWTNETGNPAAIDWTDITGQVQTPEQVRTVGAQMVRAYHKSLSPAVSQPVAVERKFRVPIPGFEDWWLVGAMDAEGVRNGQPWVFDTKTALAPWKQAKADSSMQVDAYYWARRQEGTPIDGFSFLIVTKPMFGKKVTTTELVTERSHEQIDHFQRQLQACVIQKIAMTKFSHLPAIARPEYEYHRYCPLRSRCTPWELAPESELLL